MTHPEGTPSGIPYTRPRLEKGQAGSFAVSLSEKYKIEGIFEGETGNLIATIDQVRVPEESIDWTVGSLLMGCFFRYCADSGVSAVHSDIVDEEELKLLERLFGEDKLHFMEYREEGKVEIPLRIEQAVGSLGMLNALLDYNAQDPNAIPSISVEIYMDQIDCRGWGPPLSKYPQSFQHRVATSHSRRRRKTFLLLSE